MKKEKKYDLESDDRGSNYESFIFKCRSPISYQSV